MQPTFARPALEAGEELVIALAAPVGRARLIDNAVLKFPAQLPSR